MLVQKMRHSKSVQHCRKHNEDVVHRIGATALAAASFAFKDVATNL
jgi:hypothetical protein